METSIISKRMVESRKNLGLTQNDISKITGISRVSIGNYERGSRVPDAEVLEKLASALNVSTDYLIGRTNTNVDWSEYDSKLTPKHFYDIYVAENGISLNDFFNASVKITLDNNELSSKELKAIHLFINALRELRK